MKFREFLENLVAAEKSQQRYNDLLARRKQGLPFASPEDREFFQSYAQGQHNTTHQAFRPVTRQSAFAPVGDRFEILRQKVLTKMASPEERAEFLRLSQDKTQPPTSAAKYQPTKLPEEEARAEFERLQAMNRTRQPMSAEDRARLAMYYQQKDKEDKTYDRQQGWGM